MRIALFTIGYKVNQCDTEAVAEKLEEKLCRGRIYATRQKTKLKRKRARSFDRLRMVP